MRGLKHRMHEERLRKQLSFKKRGLQGDPTAVCEYLMGGDREDSQILLESLQQN